MIKLQAINTMLLYINETPVTQADIDSVSPISIVVLADLILEENLAIYNTIFDGGVGVGDIGSVSLLVQDYIVKRASRNLFTRMIGFEDSGLEAIAMDEKMAMGNVARFCVDTNLGSTYDYALPTVYKIVEESPSLEKAWASSILIKGQIDSIVVPIGLSTTNANQYKMSVLLMSAGSELGKVEKDALTLSIIQTTIAAVFIDAKYNAIRVSLRSFIVATTYEEIALATSALKAKIDSIVSSITTLYPFFTDNNLLYTYALNRVVSEATPETAPTSRLAITREEKTLLSISKYIYSKLVSENITQKYVVDVLMSIPIDKQGITNINDVAKNIEIIENLFESSRQKILGYGFYFNTTVITLYPNTSGYIVIPTNYLSVDDTSDNLHTVRDWKLFNKDTLSFTFIAGVECVVVEDIPYDDLLNVYAEYIYADVKLDAYKSIVGVTAEINAAMSTLRDAKVTALQDDAANYDGNVLDRTFATTALDRTSL